MGFHQCICTALLAWAFPLRAREWVVVDPGEDLARQNGGLCGSSNHWLQLKTESQGEARGWRRNFHRSMMLVLWFNTIEWYFFFLILFFFSCLERNWKWFSCNGERHWRGALLWAEAPTCHSRERSNSKTYSSGLLKKCVPFFFYSRAKKSMGLGNRWAPFSIKPRCWWRIYTEKLWWSSCLTHCFNPPYLFNSKFSFWGSLNHFEHYIMVWWLYEAIRFAAPSVHPLMSGSFLNRLFLCWKYHSPPPLPPK